MTEQKTRTAAGLGLATIIASGEHEGTVLDVWYPAPLIAQTSDQSVVADLEALVETDEDRNVVREIVDVTIDLDAAPANAEDAYLRLHLLSHTLVEPNTINLEGLFGKLANVAWTNFGPVLASEFNTVSLKLRRRGALIVTHVDKFPRMIDYVVPAGVRIGDADRVRLGAHLAVGTTVMHEGFVNFNAGTLGESMVEGRISQGVVIGNGTDIGGGASTMGTLSGGGTQRVAIGERSLLGAEAGIGIALGDDCVVEAGLYVTAGSRVTLLNPGAEPQIIKAVELSGVNNLLFRRNSVTGAIEALSREGKTVELNSELHAN